MEYENIIQELMKKINQKFDSDFYFNNKGSSYNVFSFLFFFCKIIKQNFKNI